MRKTLLVIAVLFTTAQVFAATVTIEVNDIGDGWASIRYSADANVSAFGLKVTADSGAIFTDINDYNVGECTASQKGYGIFPGTIVIDTETGTVTNDGTPVAPNDDPGASGSGPNTNTLILEMGALYVEGNQPAQSGTLITVRVDGDCNVCVEGEPIRGNVVLTDGTALDPDEACAYIQLQVDCLVVDQWVGGVYITQAMYDLWVSVGEPNCWCYDCHWRGDSDGDCDVDITDIYAFLDGWADWASAPCGDTDNDGDVDITDIYNFLDGWNYSCTDPCHPDYPNSGTCTPLP